MPLNYCYGDSWYFFNLSCSSATCFSTKFFLCTRNTTWQTVSLFWQHNNTALYLKFCIIKEINLHIIKLSHLSHSGLSLVKTVSGEIACFLCEEKKKKSSPPSILKKNTREKLSEYRNDASQKTFCSKNIHVITLVYDDIGSLFPFWVKIKFDFQKHFTEWNK